MEPLDVIGLLSAIQQIERNVSISLMYSGLRVSQLRLLSLLDQVEDATVTGLSRELGITRASASVMVNELVRKGALVIEEHPSDRRSFHVRLTELGRNKLGVARRDLAVLQSKLSSHYPEATVRALNRFAAAGVRPKPVPD